MVVHGERDRHSLDTSSDVRGVGLSRHAAPPCQFWFEASQMRNPHRLEDDTVQGVARPSKLLFRAGELVGQGPRGLRADRARLPASEESTSAD